MGPSISVVVKNFLQGDTPKWFTILTAICAIAGICLAYEANKLATEANKIAHDTEARSINLYKAKELPRLIPYPLNPRFYVPTNPEVPGQVRFDMGVVMQGQNDTTSLNARLNIETRDWTGFKTNLHEISKAQGIPNPVFSSISRNSPVIYPSYSPDAPASGAAGFVNQDKPFKVKLVLEWEDVNREKYLYVGFWDLKHAALPDKKYLFYFTPTENYESVLDGQIAWQEAKRDL